VARKAKPPPRRELRFSLADIYPDPAERKAVERQIREQKPAISAADRKLLDGMLAADAGLPMKKRRPKVPRGRRPDHDWPAIFAEADRLIALGQTRKLGQDLRVWAEKNLSTPPSERRIRAQLQQRGGRKG
jgi:hypothetical protein